MKKHRHILVLGAAFVSFAATNPAFAGNETLWQAQASAATSEEFVAVMRELGIVERNNYNVSPRRFAEYLFTEMEKRSSFNSWPAQWRQRSFYINRVLEVNGWQNVNRLTAGQFFDLAKSDKLLVPLPDIAPAAASARQSTAAPAPQASASPAAAAVPTPGATPAPSASSAPKPAVAAAEAEAARVRAERDRAAAAVRTATAEIRPLQARAEREGGLPRADAARLEQLQQQREEDRRFYDSLNTRLTTLEGQIAGMNGRLTTIGGADGRGGLIGELNTSVATALSDAAKAKADAAEARKIAGEAGNGQSSFSILSYEVSMKFVVLGSLALAFLALMMSLWARFRKLPKMQASITLDVTHLATKEDLEAVKATVQSVKDQTGSADIRFGEGQREALDALPEGETLPVDVIIDGEKKFEIRFKRVENGFFVPDESKSRFKTVDPKVFFKSPFAFVCRNYGKGEFAGFMLSAVPAAA